MSVQKATIDATYAGLGVDVVYVDQAGAQAPARVLLDFSVESQLQGAELGIRGNSLVFRLRLSERACVVDGDYIEHESHRHLVAAHDRLNLYEWRIYARA